MDGAKPRRHRQGQGDFLIMTPAEFTAARERLGLDARALAAALGIADRNTVYRYENGRRTLPGPVAVLMRYFERYGTPEKAFKVGKKK